MEAIILTTKKGNLGKTKFNFRHQTDISSRLHDNITPLNQQQYLDLLKSSYENADPSFTDEEIDAELKSIFPVYTNDDGIVSFFILRVTGLVPFTGKTQ